MKEHERAKGGFKRCVSSVSQLDVAGQAEAERCQQPSASGSSRSASKDNPLPPLEPVTRSGSHHQISDHCAPVNTQNSFRRLPSAEALPAAAKGDRQAHPARRALNISPSKEDFAYPASSPTSNARSKKTRTSTSTIARLEKQYYGPRDARRMGSVAAGHPIPGTTGTDGE